MMTTHPELHVCLAPNGHVNSVTCWCEPVAIYFIRNKHGIIVKVVEHDDAEPVSMTHDGVLYARDRVQDWVTRYLDEIGDTPWPDPPHTA